MAEAKFCLLPAGSSKPNHCFRRGSKGDTSSGVQRNRMRGKIGLQKDKFDGLRKTVSEAMGLINMATIRRWEQRMWRWIACCAEGKEAQETDIAVKKHVSSPCQGSGLLLNKI